VHTVLSAISTVLIVQAWVVHTQHTLQYSTCLQVSMHGYTA
jgi:hypothetical protein